MGKFAAFFHEGTANFWGRQVSVEAKKELRHALFLVYPQLCATLRILLRKNNLQCDFFVFFCATKFAQRSKEESIVLWADFWGALFTLWAKKIAQRSKEESIRELLIKGPPDFGRGRRGGPGARGGERAEKNSESHKTTNQTKQPVSKKKAQVYWDKQWYAKNELKKTQRIFP